MRILDRYTSIVCSDSNLPKDIDLGRYAIILPNHKYGELTKGSFRLGDKQILHQGLLDETHKDKHDVLELIAQDIEGGQFKARPLIQGIKFGLEIREFERKLNENLKHIEAIFREPHTKLTRSIEKVPVSKAKRISNRSYQYLAAHTEDWLHKSLVSFHPSRVLNDEIIINEDIYENQLLVAFVIRAARYLERRLSHVRDITKFLEQYQELMEKFKNDRGWYRRVRRELGLAGSVYEEKDGNYKAGRSDLDVAVDTRKKLRNLRDKLVKLRQYDLFQTVDQRKLKSLVYHDTNVLVNHKHYRYLKQLWIDLMATEQKPEEEVLNEEETIVRNLQSYGLSIVNYALKEYLGYKNDNSGCDREWTGNNEGYAKIQVLSQDDGTVNLTIGHTKLRFVTVGSMPKEDTIATLPSNTYVLAYQLDENYDESTSANVIPIALNNISCVEMVAIVIRRYILLEYMRDNIYKKYEVPQLAPAYIRIIEETIKYVSFTDNCHFIFSDYPTMNYDRRSFDRAVRNEIASRKLDQNEQRKTIQLINSIVNNIDQVSSLFVKNFKCFDSECSLPINPWQCDKLKYIKCSCGFVLDCKDKSHIKFFNKEKCVTQEDIEDMGIDYLEIAYTDA